MKNEKIMNIVISQLWLMTGIISGKPVIGIILSAWFTYLVIRDV